MKKYLSAVIIFTLLFGGCRTSKHVAEKASAGSRDNVNEASVDFSLPETWLLGYINSDQLLQPPYSEWFVKGRDDYHPDMGVIGKLVEVNKDELTIKIILGTWCPDSRREVPRFMKILNLWDFPYGSVTLIGVDNSKRSPVGEYDMLGIERVPTFIILKNKIEVGRIIENPVTSLEQDMLNILTGNEK